MERTRRAALSPVAQPPGYRHARRFRGCPGARSMWSERRISLTIERSGANGSNLLPGPTQEERRADYWRTPRGAEQRRACKGRAAGANWRRLIRRLARGTSGRKTANQSPKGSGAGPCRKRRACRPRRCGPKPKRLRRKERASSRRWRSERFRSNHD